jgi:predicted HTH transcriptional regulator
MLKELLLQEEGKTLEFKESTRSLPGIIKTVIAFANTAGGTLVIGIEDRTKRVIGVENALDEEERLASALADNIAPLLIPTIEIQSYEDKECIVITVPYIPGPYYLKNKGMEEGTFVRFASTNRVADSALIATLQLGHKKLSYDEQPDAQSKLVDLDAAYIEKLFFSLKPHVTGEAMENLGIITDRLGSKVPSIGGILLFGKNRLRHFPDAVIRCVRFKGISKAQIIDHATYDSYLPQAYEHAMHFITRNTRTEALFQGHTISARIDQPEYPPVAVREALINAIVHADYAIPQSPILVAIFDDRLEISNPGGIPFGSTLERALAGSSRIRNRVLARVFRELKLIEQWGSGMQRIIATCAERSLMPPLFEDFTTEFKVTLYSGVEVRVPLLTEGKTISYDVGKLIAFLQHNKQVSSKQAAELLGIASRNARAKLKKLLDAGVLVRVGSNKHDPNGSYLLAERALEKRS